MENHDQLVQDRPQGAASMTSTKGIAAIRSLLVHIQSEDSVSRSLDAALAVARTCNAHISCLHVTPIEAYVASDSFGGIFVMPSVLEAVEVAASRLRSKIETHLRHEDVTWDYAEVTGHIQSRVIQRAALADLLVTSREAEDASFAGSSIGMLGDLLCRSRTPLLIAGDTGRPPDPSGPALIAWDGSYEAANAVRAALGLLSQSSSVQVLKVQEAKDETFPNTDLLEYLSRHGVHAELTIQPPDPHGAESEFIYCSLIEKAEAMDASFVVTGGYSHSRIGEYLFGGITRMLLTACPVALVVAH